MIGDQREGKGFVVQVCNLPGYMASHFGREEEKFTPKKEDELRAAIHAVLDKYDAQPGDLAITTGMDAGSELIFVECCLERRIPVQAYFAVAESSYMRDFVMPDGDEWADRFYKLRHHPLVDEFYQPDCVGLPKESDNVHERNNRWALYSAMAYGLDNVRLIAVWDGNNEPSADLDSRLVKHMVEVMRDAGGRIEQVHPHKLARYTQARHAAVAAPETAAAAKSRPRMNRNGSSPKKTPAHKK